VALSAPAVPSRAGLRPWAEREWAQLTERRPGATAALVRHRWWLVVLLAAAQGAWTAALMDRTDASLFAAAAGRLLTGQGLEVFQDPALQVGPLYLLLLAPMVLLGDLLGVSPVASAGAGSAVVLVLGAVRLAGLLGADGFRRACLLGSMVVLGPVAASVGFGHSEEVLVGLCLLAAGLVLDRGTAPWWVAPLLVAAAADVKLWGALGGVLLILAPTWRQRFASGLLTCAAVAAAYLPFALVGGMQTGSYVWTVNPKAPASLLLEAGAAFTWTDRLSQGALVMACALLCARWRPHPGVLMVAVLMLVRLATDPLPFSYYWTPLIVMALVLVWAAPWSLERSAAATIVGLPVACAWPFVGPSIPLTVGLGSVLVVVVVRACRAAQPALAA
jgi:hypothetical protein